MKSKQYQAQAAKLYEWVHGKEGRTFFVNGYLGHKLSTNGDTLLITEADNGGQKYGGQIIEIAAEDIESMEFDAEEYHVHILTTEESEHNGQGYEIEAYDLERVEFPA